VLEASHVTLIGFNRPVSLGRGRHFTLECVRYSKNEERTFLSWMPNKLKVSSMMRTEYGL